MDDVEEINQAELDIRHRRSGQNKHTIAAIAARKVACVQMLPLLDAMEASFRVVDTDYIGGVLLQIQAMRELCFFWGDVPTSRAVSEDGQREQEDR